MEYRYLDAAGPDPAEFFARVPQEVGEIKLLRGILLSAFLDVADRDPGVRAEVSRWFRFPDLGWVSLRLICQVLDLSLPAVQREARIRFQAPPATRQRKFRTLL